MLDHFVLHHLVPSLIQGSFRTSLSWHPWYVRKICNFFHCPFYIYFQFSVSSSSYEHIESVRGILQLELKVIDSIRQPLLGFLSESIVYSADIDSVAGSIVTVALKLFANLLCLTEESRQIEGNIRRAGDSTSENQESLTYFKPFISLLFESIESNGARLGKLRPAAEKKAIYLVSAECAILMTKLNVFGDMISVDNWRRLSHCFLNDDQAFRQKLIDTFSSIVHTHPINMKFLSFACLLSTDPVTSEQSTKALTFAIKRLRRTQEELASKALSEVENIRRDSLNKFATKHMPELILPYLLYLLSYEPWFPSSVNCESIEDSQKMRNIFACIQNLLQCFQVTLRVETSNMPFLFKILNLMITEVYDRNDINNRRLHILAFFVLKLLNERVKSSENCQVYPADIAFPKDLFVRHLAEHENGNGLDVLENQAEKLLRVIQKGKNKTFLTASLSPAKQKFTASIIQEPTKKKSDIDWKEHSSIKTTQLANNDTKPTRVLPTRSAKSSVVSYVVPEEDDNEVEKWDTVTKSHSLLVEDQRKDTTQQQRKRRSFFEV